MNDNGYGNNRNPDIPDFNSRRDMDTIRRNEDYERQIRMKRAAMLQKQQRLKQLRQQQIKQAVTAWAILLFVVFAVIAILTGIFNYLALASAGLTGDRGLKLHSTHSLNHSALTATSAGSTGLRRRSLCSARARAVRAALYTIERNVLLDSESRLFK